MGREGKLTRQYHLQFRVRVAKKLEPRESLYGLITEYTQNHIQNPGII